MNTATATPTFKQWLQREKGKTYPDYTPDDIREYNQLTALSDAPAAGTQPHDAEHSPRDFDACAYRSRSGKSSCGALRYYHDQIVKGHAFVEPERMLTDAEKIVALVEALRNLMSRFEQTGEAWMSDPAIIAAREALRAAEKEV